MAAQSSFIELVSQSPVGRVLRENVYFAFGSGRFKYDCVECGAKCCRGHGYQLHAEDVPYQLSQRHTLAVFLDKPSGPAGEYIVQNLAPSCFFLSEDGRCDIQSRHGYCAKPETCRLFPFNNLRKVRKYLVVSPHLSLCPLEVAAGSGSSCSDHDKLYETMAAFGIRSSIHEAIATTGDVDTAIKQEVQIRALCDELSHLAIYRPLAVEQLRLLKGPVDDDSAETAVERFEHDMFEALGERPSREALMNPSLVTTMIAVTPVLRSQLLFLATRDRRAPEALVPACRIPYVLIALNALAALAIDAGMRRVTYQTVMSLFTGSRSLLAILACADQSMRWRPSSAVVWPLKHEREFEPGYLAVVKSLLRGRHGQTLGELLSINAPTDGPRRSVFLKQVARALIGRISAEAEDARGGRWNPRRAIQRLTLQHLSPTLLDAIAERQARRRSETSCPPNPTDEDRPTALN